jgi:hypothetical protein
MKKIKFISGASSNHFHSLCSLIQSIPKIPSVNITIYDLGLDQKQLTHLQENNNINLKYFHFDKLPQYYDITIDAGKYAWKPLIIKTETSIARKHNYEYLIWLDAGCLWIDSDFDKWTYDLDKNKIYSPCSSGRIEDWCFENTMDVLNLNEKIRTGKNRSGGVLGIKLNYEPNIKLINRWNRYSQNKNIIAPFGANRENHRYDQSLLSILIEQWTKLGHYKNLTDELLSIKIHQDNHQDLIQQSKESGRS